MIESCYTEDTVEEKRQCLFDNLNERIDQSFSRMQDALIHVNGARVRNTVAPSERTITKSRGLVSIPVNLVAGANQIKIDYIGYSTARLEYSLEPAPETPPSPQAYFLTNRIQATTAQSFNLNARESFSPDGNILSYSWLWGDEPVGALPALGAMTATHTYAAPGVYTASLLVTDTVTLQTSTFSLDLVVKAANPSVPTVNEKPKPVIQWALDGSNPLRVLFDGTQSTDDGSISTYTWRFTNQAGVSDTVTGPTFYYNFSNPGAYTVRLTVRDNLNLAASVDRVISVAPISTLVADEILFAEKTYFGTVSTESVTDETLTLPMPKLARLKIKNADGLEHPVQNCCLIAWPAKIECLYTNLVNKTYLSLYRVNSINIFINGRKVTDATSINKQKATFETVVALNAVNTVQIRVRGWPTAFATVEIQALEENVPPVADVTFEPPLPGVPRTVEFNAASSTDANDQIMSYRFQAKLHGTADYTLDSDWQADPIGSLTFTQVGSYDVLISARDKFGAVGTKTEALIILSNSAPVFTDKYFLALNNTAPYQVRVQVQATDADPGDTLQYNFEFSNGQSTGFQTLNRATTTFSSAGNKLATVTVRDSSGATAQTTVPIVVGGNLIPIPVVVWVPSRGGYAPFTIDFNGSFSSDPDGPQSDLRFFWNFGDGSPTAEGMHVTHTFPPGTWLVTLTVIDAFNGAASFARYVYSWVNEPPVPSFTFSRVSNSLDVDFDTSGSTPGDSPIVSRRLEFGDGTAQNLTSSTTRHTYPRAGIFNAALSVTDQEGDANVQIQSVAVFNGQKPSANINLVSSDVILPASFELNAVGSLSPNLNAAITGHRWTLPGGEVRTTPSITYTTTTHGNFDIQLEVQDSYGFWSDPVTRTYSASVGVLPVAQIQVNKTSIALGQPIDLFGSNSYTLNAGANLSVFEWTMPNGTVLFGQNQRVTLQSTGLKTISLKVTDSKGYVSNVATVQVNVVARQNPTAVIELTTNGSTMLPVPASVSGLGSTTPNPGATIVGYEWRITADTTPTPTDFTFFGATGNYTITQAGLWTIALRVFDSAGGTSPWVSVNYGPTVNNIPVAVINPNGLVSTAPGDITLNGLSSTDPDGHSIINWHWRFSDGGEAWGPMPTRFFQNAGEYTATLRVQDEFYAWSDPVTITISLIRNELPIGLFTVANDPTNRYRKTFDASASFDMDGTITAYFWYVISPGDTGGAVGIGTGQELTYIFPGVGTYTVVLDVYDNNGRKSVATLRDVTITDQPTILKANYEVDEVNPMRFAFRASETTDADGLQGFKWTENGADLSNVADFEYTFSTEGVHNVTLEVRDTFGSLTSKTFSVSAFESPIVGITLLAADLDPIEFFDASSIEAQTPMSISRLPASVRLQPVLRTPRGELDFSWSVNGINSGNSDALTTAIVEPGATEIDLKVTDGENIVARVKRTAEVEATACSGDSGEICVGVQGGAKGPSLNTEDLVFEIPHGEDITSVGRLVIRTIDTSEEFDFTEDAVISGQTVSVPRAVLKSRLNYEPGPFEAEMEVAGETDTNFGVVPYFHLSGPSLIAPTDLENASIKLFDAMNGRVILEKSIVSGEVINAPWAPLEVEITERSGELNWTSRGRSSSRTDAPIELIRQRSSNLLGLGSVTTRVVYTPEDALNEANVFSKMSSVTAQSTTPGNTQLEGVVAGTNSYLRNLTITQDVFYTGEFSSPMGEGVAAKFSMKSEFVPWQSDNDSPDIIGADTDQNRTLECKAFESAWNATPALIDYYKRLPAYIGLYRQISDINKVVTPRLEALRAEYAWRDANLRSPCGHSGSYDPDCMSTFPHEGYFGNSAAAAARALGFASIYYDYQRISQAMGPTYQQLYDESQAYLQDGVNLGLSQFYGTMDFQWTSVGVSDNREFTVKANYLRKSVWSSKTYKFSSRGLKGLFEPPLVGPGVYQVPLNPFSVPLTRSVPVPIQIPKGTEAVTFEVFPTKRQIESTRFNGWGPNEVKNGGTREAFSAACRFAESDGYTIRSVTNAPDLTNPSIEPGALAMLRKIDFGLPPQILMLIRGNLTTPDLHLSRAVSYVSKSLFSPGGFLPVDIDATDTGTHSNTLWSRVGIFPQPALLNHTVRVEVDHPPGTPPERLEFVAYSSENSAPLIRVFGTHLTSAFTRSVYRIDIPVDSLVLAARSTALSPQPNDIQLTLEFRPIAPAFSTAAVAPRLYAPKVLFNARYKNFFDSSSGPRTNYGGHSSSLISYRMAKAIVALDTIGVTSARPGHTNDLLINDGSLPFGLSFEDDHSTHEDGEKLDIRTFGLPRSDYDTVTKVKRKFVGFADTSKFGDIAKLIRVTRAAHEANPTDAPLLRENECVINTSNPSAINPCLNQVTIEECLFIVGSPVPDSSCAKIHKLVYNASPAIVSKADSVSAHNRLRSWVLRNREVVFDFKTVSTTLNLNTVFYYSTGASETSRAAMVQLINNGSNPIGKMRQVNGQVVADSLADDWNMASLLRGEIPSTKNASGDFGESYSLVLENGVPLPDATSDISAMFQPESATGHFDHFHLKPRGSR